jgi:hypothetical protein
VDPQQEINALLRTVQRVPNTQLATVVQELRVKGYPSGQLLVDMAGQRITARVDPGVTYWPNDIVRVQAEGDAANAQYKVVGFTMGARPDAYYGQVTAPTEIGGTTYPPGDAYFGNSGPQSPHLWIEYNTGILRQLIGDRIMQAMYPNGDVDHGPPDDMHWHYDAATSSMQLRHGDTILAEFAGDSLSMIG